MNILPKYIFVCQIIKKISLERVNLYRFFPVRLLYKMFFYRITNKVDYHKRIQLLNKHFGNLEAFNSYCKKHDEKIKEANKALKHKFNILGYGEVTLQQIDWHYDFIHNFKWEKGKFYRKYDRFGINNISDIKIPWELNRFHHFLQLGQGYLITKDEIYVTEIKKQFYDWVKENPFLFSINWTSSMEVAIRAVNWIVAINMIKSSLEFDEKFFDEFSFILYLHGVYIFNNLEKYFPYSGNHYAANLVGLIYLGFYFRDFDFGEKWLDFAVNELYKEIRTQILPSGVHFEKSIGYHRLVVELFFYSFLLLKRNKYSVPQDVYVRLQKMFDFVLYYIEPSGKAPNVGDIDNGRLLPFHFYENDDHRYLLSMAAVCFDEPLYKKYSFGYTAEAFILGADILPENFNSIAKTKETLQSAKFLDAGYFIMRYNDYYIFINNESIDKYSADIDDMPQTSSHTHADLLSFTYTIGESRFIVDPGSFVYTSALVERNKFRGTACHNTVVIDGENQHKIYEKKLFHFLKVAKPIKNEFSENEHQIIFIGAHNGYMRLSEGVIHNRKFVFDKIEKSLQIVDSITGKGEHLFESFLHFGTGIKLEKNKNNIIATDTVNGKKIKICFFESNLLLITLDESYISPSYGIKEKSAVLKIHARIKCPYTLKFKIQEIYE
jgi:hypothetical protein